MSRPYSSKHFAANSGGCSTVIRIPGVGRWTRSVSHWFLDDIGTDSDSLLWHVGGVRDKSRFYWQDWTEEDPPPLTRWARRKERELYHRTLDERYLRDDPDHELWPASSRKKLATRDAARAARIAARDAEQANALQAVSSVLDTGSLPPVPVSQ